MNVFKEERKSEGEEHECVLSVSVAALTVATESLNKRYKKKKSQRKSLKVHLASSGIYFLEATLPSSACGQSDF